MVLFFLKSSGQYLSIEYKLISVGGLWAEQFAVEIDPFYQNLSKIWNPRKWQNEKSVKFFKSSGQGLSKKYRTISVGGLWAEQFAIEIDQFYEKLWKFQKSQFSKKCQNVRFNTSISIANCSAHRWPTEMTNLN